MSAAFFDIDDVARIFGEEHAHRVGSTTATPLSKETVWDYVKRSRPGGRYAERPMPAPVGGVRTLIWMPGEGQTLADLERELRVWFTGRPGHGAGGGHKPKPRDTWCPCGCKTMVIAGSACPKELGRRKRARRKQRDQAGQLATAGEKGAAS